MATKLVIATLDFKQAYGTVGLSSPQNGAPSGACTCTELWHTFLGLVRDRRFLIAVRKVKSHSRCDLVGSDMEPLITS